MHIRSQRAHFSLTQTHCKSRLRCQQSTVAEHFLADVEPPPNMQDDLKIACQARLTFGSLVSPAYSKAICTRIRAPAQHTWLRVSCNYLPTTEQLTSLIARYGPFHFVSKIFQFIHTIAWKAFLQWHLYRPCIQLILVLPILQACMIWCFKNQRWTCKWK